MIAARPLIELAYHLTLRAGCTEQPIAPVVLFVLDQGIPPREAVGRIEMPACRADPMDLPKCYVEPPRQGWQGLYVCLV